MDALMPVPQSGSLCDKEHCSQWPLAGHWAREESSLTQKLQFRHEATIKEKDVGRTASYIA